MIDISTLTADQIDRMTGDEYAANMKNPEFIARVNEIGDAPVQRKATTEASAASKELAAARARAAAGFDPSFDDDPNAPRPAVAPVTPIAPVTPAAAVVAEVPAHLVIVPAPVVETPALKKFEVRYQPTDATGRPVGGEQVVKYEAATEISQDHPLIQQLIKNHSAATAELRRLRAGALTSDTEVPENSTKFPTMTEFFVLNAEQRVALEAEAADPSTGAAARAKLADSARNAALNQSQEDIFTVRAQLALANFKANNPDFYRCNENATAIINYVTNKNLDPTDENNLQKAFDILREAGALYGRPVTNQPAAPALVTEAPIVREEKTAPNTQVPVVEPARIGEATPPQATRPVSQIPTGLSNIDIQTDGEPNEVAIESQLVYKRVLKDGNGRPTGVVETYVGIEALDKMPAAELRALLEKDVREERSTGKGTGFRKTVDSLEALRDKRLQERRNRFRR